MAQELVNIGAAPSDGSGDAIRVSFDKINKNFTELYTQYTDIAANVAIINNPVISVCGKTGRVKLVISDIVGGVSAGYVDNRVTEQVNTVLGDMVGGAPEIIDTLLELSNAVTNNPGVAVDIFAQLSTKLAKTGGTLTGPLHLNAMPVDATESANKQYVDLVASSKANVADVTAALSAINAAIAANNAVDLTQPQTSSVYSKAEIDLMLLNITSNNGDWGFISNIDDYGNINGPVDYTADYGSIQ